jgi:hypothetical protein
VNEAKPRENRGFGGNRSGGNRGFGFGAGRNTRRNFGGGDRNRTPRW